DTSHRVSMFLQVDLKCPKGREERDGMNSQLKDALNEFINRNSAAIEQAMENTSNAKDEPLIQDLVNYLSDSKDNQTVSMEDRSSVQQSLNCEANLDLTQLGHFKPPLPKSKSEDTLNNVGHVCGSESDTSLNGNLSSSTFDRPRDHHSDKVSSLLSASDSQCERSEDPLQLNFASDASRQYSHPQSAQFPSIDNDTGQFQNVPQMCSNGFMDSSVLSSSSFTTPASSQMPHSTTHNGHGYILMDVTLTSVSNMDADGSQVKLPEKMQMDEPEVTFQHAEVPTNDDQYQSAQNQTLDQHFQAYSSQSFSLLTTLDNVQDSAHSRFLNGCDFEQNLNTTESNSSANSNGASVVTTHATTAFNLCVNTRESSLSGHVNTCESSLSGPFTSQNFQKSMTELTPSSVQDLTADFQGQTSPGQVNSVNSDTTNSTQYSDSTELSASPSPNAAYFNHTSNYLSPYQSSQYQDSPTHGHSSPNIADALRISIMNSASPVAGLSPNHQLYQHSNSGSPSCQQPQSSHQSSPVNHDKYQQNSPAGSTHASSATVVHSLDQHVMTYQGNPETTSHLNLIHQNQSAEIMAPYEPSSSIATVASGQCGGQHTESHFGSSTFDLPSASQMTDLHFDSQMSMKTFPQPMQVQDSEFLNHSSAAIEKTKMNTETSMDTSSDLGEHPGGISHRISFEEIHMSIINAGHRLSQELCGTNIEQTVFRKATHSLIDEVKPTGCYSDVTSFRDLQTIHMEASKIDGTLCSNVSSDDPRLQSAVSISESSPMQSSENVSFSGSFNNNSNTTFMLTNSSSFPNLNADHHLLGNMLNSNQAPAESHQLQPENLITNQPIITVPNFLQNPVSGNSANSQDHQNLMRSKNSAENLHHFVGTAPSATQFNSGTAISSSENQLSGTSMGNHSAAVNLLQYLSSLSQSGSACVNKTIRNGTNPQSSQEDSTVSRNLTETTVCDAAPNSETSVQSASFVKASMTSTYSNTLKDPGVLEADAGHGSSGSLNGKISFGLSAGLSSTKENDDPGAADASSNQPHIVMSLEDLQQLILEQKSHSSSPVLHQLSHGAASSPQPLVLQKHASHSLRHTQPRVMVRGMTLPNATRAMNPHQQVLHSRDGTQYLPDKMQQSEHISETETTSRRHPELAVTFTDQEHQQKLGSHSFHIPLVSQTDQQQSHPLSMEHYSQPKPIEQQSQPKPIEQQSQPKPLEQQSQPKTNEQQTQYKISQQLKQTDYQQQQQWTINGFLKENQSPNDNNSAPLQQHLILSHGHHPAQTDQNYIHTDQFFIQSESSQHIHNVIQPALKQEEQKQLPKQDKDQQLDGHQMRSFYLQFKEHLQSAEQPERNDRPCNESLKSEYRHLHSLLVGDTPAVLNQAGNINAKDQQSSEAKNSDVDMDSTIFQSELTQSTSMLKVEDPSPINSESHAAVDGSSNRQTSLLAQILTERKRCHSSLSVSLHSPAHSDSEDPSPLSSPAFDDGNTQSTLIERSAGLQIKSDHHHSGNDGDDDENAIFDLNAFHKRPSADELHSSRENNVNVPMKIAKPSVDADAHTSINPPPSPDSKFDFGGAVSSASNFSFAFGNKEGKKPGMFTFGSSGTAPPTNDSQPSCSKPLAKAVAMRSAVPTQPVRPTTRRQKEHSLKASYPGKVDGVELKILAQPEPQHRARYQTEGSRGAIKDESQQGYPIIKLCGYSQATKLQVYIGDEGAKAKPHGFYQACRVSGKNSTSCVEQEIEGTVVLEVDLLPENNMTVKLDCIGILKLRNADVEGRIGPKRARDKKKTNTRARLVMRCSFEKSDGRQYFLQVASNPIVCTQPVGQPEISRMSLTECNVHGGDSLFIIGKNFRNKGTSVLFQTVDSTDDYVTWQAEAQIEQEYFQPTHLICKIPPYKDKSIKTLQEAQIVVSCAGKMSDPHSFIYKPVYHMVSPVKQEVLMETDTSASARTLPFVSPEALHLNRMVQQTHAQSSANSLFQLPANTFPDMQTRAVQSPSATTFKGFRPAVLRNLTPNTAESSDLVSVLPPSPSSVSFASGPSKSSRTRPLSKQSSVFGEKYECNGFVQRSSGQTVSGVITNGATNSATNNSMGNFFHPLMSVVSATSAGPTVGHTDLLSTGAGPTVSHKDLVSTVATSVPSSPFFLVVDPAMFQSTAGGDKIQQLLLQILEAQSKLVSTTSLFSVSYFLIKSVDLLHS
ncbi:unnamed protein product, partial [Candidula unifasciata]